MRCTEAAVRNMEEMVYGLLLTGSHEREGAFHRVSAVWALLIGFPVSEKIIRLMKMKHWRVCRRARILLRMRRRVWQSRYDATVANPPRAFRLLPTEAVSKQHYQQSQSGESCVDWRSRTPRARGQAAYSPENNDSI